MQRGPTLTRPHPDPNQEDIPCSDAVEAALKVPSMEVGALTMLGQGQGQGRGRGRGQGQGLG